ncbi:hypothetical protein LQ226_02610 [Pontibacillus sp. HN14]|nr:hypothetical protein [Pontibacillus sp. HN14]
MSFKKQATVMSSNAVLGVFTCYLYLYFWIFLSMAAPIFNIKALLSLIISLTLFGVLNVLLIGRGQKREWLYAFLTYFGAIALFVGIFWAY